MITGRWRMNTCVWGGDRSTPRAHWFTSTLGTHLGVGLKTQMPVPTLLIPPLVRGTSSLEQCFSNYLGWKDQFFNRYFVTIYILQKTKSHLSLLQPCQVAKRVPKHPLLLLYLLINQDSFAWHDFRGPILLEITANLEVLGHCASASGQQRLSCFYSNL